MVIYQILKTVQGYDSDAWNHWPEQETIQYHATKNGAEAAISKLIVEEMQRLQNEHEYSIKHHHPEYDIRWQRMYRVHLVRTAMNNVIISVGSDGKTQVCSLFTIKEVIIHD